VISSNLNVTVTLVLATHNPFPLSSFDIAPPKKNYTAKRHRFGNCTRLQVRDLASAFPFGGGLSTMFCLPPLVAICTCLDMEASKIPPFDGRLAHIVRPRVGRVFSQTMAVYFGSTSFVTSY
jgi:hypothetical protein